MLSLRPLQKSDAPFLLSVYHEAFPAEERMEDALLLSLAEEGSLLHLIIEEEGRPLGFFTLSVGPCAYLYYFAVEKSERNRGIGGGALSLLFDRFAPLPVAVDLERLCDEAPNAQERRRRRAFYACGRAFTVGNSSSKTAFAACARIEVGRCHCNCNDGRCFRLDGCA